MSERLSGLIRYLPRALAEWKESGKQDVLDQILIVPSSPVLIAPDPSGKAVMEYTKDECPDNEVLGSALSRE
jgi:hypothetical protein